MDDVDESSWGVAAEPGVDVAASVGADSGDAANPSDAEAVKDAVETEAEVAKSVSLLRTADAIDDSKPRSRRAVRYSLNAVSERRRGCEVRAWA